MHVKKKCISINTLYTYIFIYIHIYIYTYTHTYIFIYTYIHIHICIRSSWSPARFTCRRERDREYIHICIYEYICV